MSITAIILAAGNSRRMGQLTKDVPKSMLKVGNMKVIEYHLDNLYRNKVSEIIIVVGYLSEVIKSYVGEIYRSIPVKYVLNSEFASTGHSYSLFLSLSSINNKNSEILIVHADGILDPEIYKNTIASAAKNVMPYDSEYEIKTNDEVFIYSKNDLVTNVSKLNKDCNLSGEMIGLHKFDLEFIKSFRNYLNNLDYDWKIFNYEPLLNNFIKDNSPIIKALNISPNLWINMNYKEDFEFANAYLIPELKKKGTNKISFYSELKNLWSHNFDISEKESTLINIEKYINFKNIPSEFNHNYLNSLDINSLREEILLTIKKNYGFVVLRGLNILKKDQQIKSFFEFICQKLGNLIIQDSGNTVFYPVYNEGLSMSDGGRYSRSSDSGSFHTDNPAEENVPDLVGLLSIKEALEGGLSCIVNMFLVIEELYLNYPHLTDLLRKKYKFNRKNKHNENVKVNEFPILKLGKEFSFRYLSDYINKENENENKLKILELLDQELLKQKFRKEFPLSRGDILFFDNMKLAHGRTSFVESLIKEERRMMYRVWISTLK